MEGDARGTGRSVSRAARRVATPGWSRAPRHASRLWSPRQGPHRWMVGVWRFGIKGRSRGASGRRGRRGMRWSRGLTTFRRINGGRGWINHCASQGPHYFVKALVDAYESFGGFPTGAIGVIAYICVDGRWVWRWRGGRGIERHGRGKEGWLGLLPTYEVGLIRMSRVQQRLEAVELGRVVILQFLGNIWKSHRSQQFLTKMIIHLLRGETRMG